MAIMSMTACSQGLTLTAATAVVFAELTWTPTLIAQAEDRAHRISQHNSVNIYYMYGPDTLDDAIFNMLHRKSEVIAEAIDGGGASKQQNMGITTVVGPHPSNQI